MLKKSTTLAFAALLSVSIPAFSEVRLDLLGSPANFTAAQRTIIITPETKWVNVEGGEVVNFVVGDKAFVWDFYIGTGSISFDLSRVSPPGILTRRVTAYVSPDPKYKDRY